MEFQLIALLALFVLTFGLVSKRLESTSISAPMIFSLFGVGLTLLAGLHLDIEMPWIHSLAEITLVLVLFTDASRIDLTKLREDHNLPVRMLAIGLPLTMIVGAAVAIGLLPQLAFWEAILLAIILAPTDAALGQAVVSSPKLPVRIRQTLNVESGLNDGIALPILLFVLCLAGSRNHPEEGLFWLGFAAKQVLLGPLVGVAVGWIGGHIASRAADRGWMSHPFQQLSALSLSLLAFAGAELVGGNGFLAAFCAGLVLGNIGSSLVKKVYEFGEAEGQLLGFLTFTIFGAAMLLPAIAHAGLREWSYALLSLTVIRLIPVALSLIGSKLQLSTQLFLGWFGPRGIASILYGLVVLETVEIPGRETIFHVTVITVALSIVLHGLSAWPATLAYSRLVAEETPEFEEEMQEVSTMPGRCSVDG